MKVSVETVSSSDADRELGSGLNICVCVSACVHTRRSILLSIPNIRILLWSYVLFICYFLGICAIRKLLPVEERVLNFREGNF